MAAEPVAGSAPVDLERLDRLCESALQAVGYQLVELELVRERTGWLLRVFLDHPQDGPADRSVAPRRINHDDCRRASHQLGTVLDVEDPIGFAYRLEVSSPGVFRPVRKERDFVRFSGFQARIKLREPLEGRKSLAGELRGAEGGVVTLLEDGREWRLPLGLIRNAQLAEEY
ncbi:MAG: ribosome maturation factor RimP [Proteobacteria bacterium]|nr:ribosome maturation factor RimP [Pseudomonadota bacterium]